MSEKAPEPEIDTDLTDNIICPWCGYMYTDGDDFFTESYDSEVETDCQCCEKTFFAFRHVSVDYSTSKGEPKP